MLVLGKKDRKWPGYEGVFLNQFQKNRKTASGAEKRKPIARIIGKNTSYELHNRRALPTDTETYGLGAAGR